MRRTAFLVATWLLLLLAPACGTPRPAPEAVTITFACRDYQRDWYQELAEAFHKAHPGVVVQLVSIDEILGQTTTGGVATASSDDIVQVAHAADTMVQFYGMLGDRPQDFLLDLADLAAHDSEFLREDFYPAALALFERGDQLWGLPFEVETLLLYYHPKLFDEAGVPYPEAGWTWDDLLDAAARLTIRDGDVVQQYGYVDQWASYTLPLIAHQAAGPLIVEEHEVTQARLDDPRVAEAVQRYADLATQYQVMPDPARMDHAALQQVVQNESPAMWTGFTYEWDNFQHCCDARAVPLPGSGQPAAYISGNGYMISAGTAHPREAWRWIEFLTRQPPYRYSRGSHARKSVADSSGQWNEMDPGLAAAFQYNLEHAVYYPGLVRRGLNQAFEAALQGDPVQAALAAAQAEANEALARLEAEPAEPTEEFEVAEIEPTPTPGGTLIRFYVPRAFGTDWSVYRTLVDRFREQHPGISVQVEAGPELPLAELVASADCLVGRASLVYEGTTGSLLSLDPAMDPDPGFDREVFYPHYLREVEVDGMLWGLPLETDASLLYYNRFLFDRADAPYPAAGWTPQELIEQATALTDTSVPEPIYGFSPRDGAYADAPSYVAWLGGQLFDAAGRPAFDDPTVVEALGAYADLIRNASPPQVQERKGDRWAGYVQTIGGHPGQVSSGRIAMWVDTVAAHRGAPELPFEVGIAPLPAGAAPLERPSTRALFISAGTPYAEACWAWIAFLSGQPEAVQWLPVRRDVAESRAGWGDATGETVDAWQSVLGREEAAPPPSRYARALYWLDEALAQVLAGASPFEALAQAQGKASAFADCLAGSAEAPDAWRACAQQADPEVALP